MAEELRKGEVVTFEINGKPRKGIISRKVGTGLYDIMVKEKNQDVRLYEKSVKPVGLNVFDCLGRFKCLKCRGSGRFVYLEGGMRGGMDVERECDRCKGKGYVPSNKENEPYY